MRRPHGAALFAAASIVLAGLAAYWNSFQGAFTFDDYGSIVDNPTLRHPWSIRQLLLPPLSGLTVQGRPLLNLSLAFNYAIGGLHPWSYHAVNLTLHLLAGLTLFGLVRRTLILPRFQERMGHASTGIAAAVALLWVVHPLQTESVTYIVQRAESLAGFLYLLTMFLSLRGFTASRPRGWQVAAVVACLLGMAAKEVMVSAPLIVLLFDGLFVESSLRAAFRKRRGFYFALFLTWGLLATLVVHTGNRGNGAGFGLGRSSWEYLATQGWAIAHYLRLTFWPHPLILDYGWDVAHGLQDIVPYAAFIGMLLFATFSALRGRHWLGFLGAWFFAILAPSSSVVPLVSQTVAEHRMYLPLAAVVTGAVVGGYLFCTRWRLGRAIPATLVGMLAVVFGYLTAMRNEDYRSIESIWRDTLRKRPQNSRASSNLGHRLVVEGRLDEAVGIYREAVRMHPKFEDTHMNLGVALAARGDLAEAIESYRRALAIEPQFAEASTHLGLALSAQGRYAEAIPHYRHALSLQPDAAGTYNNLGDALFKEGRIEEAIAEFRHALRLQPESAVIRQNLDTALRRQPPAR